MRPSTRTSRSISRSLAARASTCSKTLKLLLVSPYRRLSTLAFYKMLTYILPAGVNNSDLKFEWKVDSSLGSEKQYGLRILLSTDKDSYQWSERFTIKKAEGGSSNSADTSSTTMSVSGTKSDSETPSSTVSVSSAKSTKANQPTSSVQTNANTVAPVTSTSTSTSTNTGSSTGSSTSSQSAATTTTPTAGARQTAAPVMAALGGVVAAMFVL